MKDIIGTLSKRLDQEKSAPDRNCEKLHESPRETKFDADLKKSFQVT